MARYKDTKLRRTNKKDHYATTLYNKVPERNDDMYFIAQEGDRCDNLAVRFYNDPEMWWFIARINHLNTMNIPAGTKLRIPISTKDSEGR